MTSPADQHPVPTDPLTTAPVRVLVADDHVLVRQGLELALSSTPGLTVCGSAPDGVEAVRQALEQHPDVVVLDVSMPGGDGLSAARELRRLLPGLRIVVLTWMAGSRRAALEAGADLFLLKDVAPAVLVERIRTLGAHR